MLRKHGKGRRSSPLWKGPEADGITQNLLSRFLVDRERFRLLVVEGLRPADSWNHRTGYGDMWHVCEQALAQHEKDGLWETRLWDHSRQKCQRFPTQVEEITKWAEICKRQFPLYVEHWRHHEDNQKRQNLMAEKVFDITYKLPSGRFVRLRGKWDSVDLIGSGKKARVYLQENKTKGDIDEVQMKRQLTFDLQTMLYLVALSCSGQKPAGTRYNVVRRPLSGGRGTIRPNAAKTKKDRKTGIVTIAKPAETMPQFYDRLAGLIKADPDFYFMRWRTEVELGDLMRFRGECLDPVLEALCDWWGFITENPDPFFNAGGRGTHWRYPFGVYNPLDEGNASDLDEHLVSGSMVGLQRVENLFPELT
jgi:hypothetical protein